jgi:uncharacterized membrane protein YfcA
VTASPELLLQMLGLLVAVGLFAGLLAGLLGVGGGIVLVPAFLYVFRTLGFDGPQLMQLCLGTSLATIVVTSARSVQSHHRKGAVDWAILRHWGPFIVAGALAGVLVASRLRSDALALIFGILALTVALYLGFGRADWRLAGQMPRGVRRAVVGPLIGFFSALMGIGGGSFGVPMMTLHGVPMHRAVGTAAGFGLIIAVPGVAAFMAVPVDPATRPPLTIGAVNLVAFGLVVAMTLISAPLGARLAHRLDAGRLRRIFAVFLGVVAINMLRGALG